ncbi:hypothetical protein, partial [Vreelandella olivaria]|uniref:hypothetical protein n=1 Tax=Vreelandella olivaria TaxID=390919 RepID=UPI00201EEBAB
ERVAEGCAEVTTLVDQADRAGTGQCSGTGIHHRGTHGIVDQATGSGTRPGGRDDADRERGARPEGIANSSNCHGWLPPAAS